MEPEVHARESGQGDRHLGELESEKQVQPGQAEQRMNHPAKQEGIGIPEDIFLGVEKAQLEPAFLAGQKTEPVFMQGQDQATIGWIPDYPAPAGKNELTEKYKQSRQACQRNY